MFAVLSALYGPISRLVVFVPTSANAYTCERFNGVNLCQLQRPIVLFLFAR